jgi:hypothetical protein
MRNWIKFTQQRYIDEDVERQWRQHVTEGEKDSLSWKEYRDVVYGFLDDEKADSEDRLEDSQYSYK